MDRIYLRKKLSCRVGFLYVVEHPKLQMDVVRFAESNLK